jgi:hypothetical protein
MAALHPERVEALVLYGTYARRRAEDYPWAQHPRERGAGHGANWSPIGQTEHSQLPSDEPKSLLGALAQVENEPSNL